MGHQNWSSDAPCTRLNDWCKKWWVNANMIFSKDVCILVLKDFVRGLSRLIVLMLLDDDACEETRFSCNLLVKWEAFYTGLNSLFLFMDCKGRTFTTVTGSWKVKICIVFCKMGAIYLFVVNEKGLFTGCVGGRWRGIAGLRRVCVGRWWRCFSSQKCVWAMKNSYLCGW